MKEILGVVLSWLINCLVFWLITMCFGWEFSWEAATGVWLVRVMFSMRVV